MDTFGTSHFKEVVFSSEVSIIEKGPQNVSFRERERKREGG